MSAWGARSGGSDKDGRREGEKEVPSALKTVAAPQLT